MELAEPLRQTAVNTIKFLAVDAIEKANSGHPGMPMGCADIALELWTRHLRYDPTNPHWPNRDRFVLSAGHGSMLLYSMLHLSGYDLPLSELQRFRQLDSKTPGHPEHGMTVGVETTTGPLGQGIANAVGLALAGKMLAARFPETPGLADHRIFGICGDGDMMEGVSHEACSLAGHLGLGNLKFIYDDNHISLDGPTDWTFSEDVAKRFESYGWFVQRIDGHDPAQIRNALDAAVAEHARPSLICARTHIGHGAPSKQDSAKAHGSPLGKGETEGAKKAAGWPTEPTFIIPNEVREAFAARAKENAAAVTAWNGALAALSADDKARWAAHQKREVPADLVERLFAKAKELSAKAEPTRALAGKIEQVVAAACPWLVGGSADLDSSTHTAIEGSASISPKDPKSFAGRNVHYGVREHGMLSINNGIAVHGDGGGFVPFGATFLIFSEYCRPAIRLASLMEQQSIYVFTHDSIFLGEDGPTHQPIEQLEALRAIPGLRVVRPADAFECASAWAYAIGRKHAPTALVLSRQKVAPLPHAADPKHETLVAGAYRLLDPANAKVVLIGTGAEVALAVAAAALLEKDGIAARVVSAPCIEALEDLGDAAFDKVLPEDGLPRVTIEAGRTTGWKRFTGRKGLAIGIDRFGASAPEADLAKLFGLTPDAIAAKVKALLGAG